jgi:DNA-binding LytR/AlgR family response regulator
MHPLDCGRFDGEFGWIKGEKKMLLIAVCDDQESERNKICTAIETYLCERKISAKLLEFDCAEQLISATEGNKIKFDLIFLDIVMADMDGLNCARLIRQQDTLVNIIFLTCSTDHVCEGYEVNATAYLVKPINEGKLQAALVKAIMQVADHSHTSIVITSGGVTQRISVKQILYLESQKNRVEIAIAQTGEKLTVYTTLDRFEQLHPSAMWIRVHKSFIVNFLYVEQYTSDKFILGNGTVIPISRFYKEQARESFFKLLHSQ